jgi:hypothetical protein
MGDIGWGVGAVEEGSGGADGILVVAAEGMGLQNYGCVVCE